MNIFENNKGRTLTVLRRLLKLYPYRKNCYFCREEQPFIIEFSIFITKNYKKYSLDFSIIIYIRDNFTFYMGGGILKSIDQTWIALSSKEILSGNLDKYLK